MRTEIGRLQYDFRVTEKQGHIQGGGMLSPNRHYLVKNSEVRKRYVLIKQQRHDVSRSRVILRRCQCLSNVLQTVTRIIFLD